MFSLVMDWEDKFILRTGGLGAILGIGKSKQYWARGYERRAHHFMDGSRFNRQAKKYPNDLRIVEIFKPYRWDLPL